MTLPRKKLSNVLTILFSLNNHGIVRFEDVHWIRSEFSQWADTLLKKVNL